MYQLVLSLHSIIRWLVLIALIFAVYRGFKGWLGKSTFSKSDKTIRQVAASMVHLQFLIGIILYFISPLTGYLISHFGIAVKNPVISFFGMSHAGTMLIVVIDITIGMILSKRAATDSKKFSMMTIFYLVGLVLILIMIPWPFSPFAQRPLLYLP
ncbi:MAG: hypothetical protein ACHQJ4_03510 [Ignavibacteria bacterium]